MTLVVDAGSAKTTAYRALNDLINRGLLQNVNPAAKVPKYVYSVMETDQ